MGSVEERFDELDQLQGDLQAQLAGTEEDWDEVRTSDDWSQTDAVGEKKVITSMVRDSRSWGREVLRNIEDFRAEKVEWRRGMTLQQHRSTKSGSTNTW